MYSPKGLNINVQTFQVIYKIIAMYIIFKNIVNLQVNTP